MLMTHYSIFSATLNQKLHSPGRWFLYDGTTHPLEGNKYFESYKNLITKIIKDNNIEVIYIVKPVESSFVYTYIDRNCFNENQISDILNSFEIKECQDING